jgi:hypothetical protein
MSKPPKKTTRGILLTPEYEARLGQPRTCECCGETYPIDIKHYAPKKAEPDGVSKVCRKCQGKLATRQRLGANDDQGIELAKHTNASQRRMYWKQVNELTDELYALADDRTQEPRFKAVLAILVAATRLKTDPDGGFHEPEHQETAFRTFVHVVSRVISGWKDFGPVHDDIIGAFFNPADRVQILASRNSGKSGLTELYALWLLHRFNLVKILIVSGGSYRAGQALRSIRNMISTCPLLRYLEPSEDSPDNATRFIVGPATGKLGAFASLGSFGVGSNMVGQRCDIAILDDIETRSDQTPDKQEKLEMYAGEVFNLLNPWTTSEPWAGRVILLGTPQVPGRSLYARWAKAADEKGNLTWETCIARVFKEHPADDPRSKKTQLESRWPAKWSDAELEKKRGSISPYDWSLHWQIDLSALDADDRPIKLRDFITFRWDAASSSFPTIMRYGTGKHHGIEKGASADADDFFAAPSEVSRDTSRYITTLAAVDPSAGTTGDEIGLAVISVTAQGLAVVRHLTGIRASSTHEAMAKLAADIHRFYPNRVICEAQKDNLFPSHLASLLAKRGYPVMVEPVHSSTAKGVRVIDAITIPLASHRVVLLESVVTAEDAQETLKQLTGMKRDARGLSHDDRVDALAWALSSVSQMLLVDEATSLDMASTMKLEELRKKSIRMGGIAPGGIEELLFEGDENTERLQARLNELLDIQAQELRWGIIDPSFEKHIEAVRADLAKSNRFHQGA